MFKFGSLLDWRLAEESNKVYVAGGRGSLSSNITYRLAFRAENLGFRALGFGWIRCHYQFRYSVRSLVYDAEARRGH